MDKIIYIYILFNIKKKYLIDLYIMNYIDEIII